MCGAVLNPEQEDTASVGVASVWVDIAIDPAHMLPEALAREGLWLALRWIMRTHMHPMHVAAARVVPQGHQLAPAFVCQRQVSRFWEHVVCWCPLLPPDAALQRVAEHESD